MAQIFPFRALHYSPQLVPELSRTVTQPYDKITPEMQERYYGLSPYNLARIIRIRDESGQDSIYERARNTFHEWEEKGVLVSEREPAIYPYHQEYEAPGAVGRGKVRRGFIGLCRLEDYAARVVYRHEETLSAPKADRLELLRATRAHFGQIFFLYSDPEATIERLLEPATRERAWEHLADEYETRHTVWKAADPDLLEAVSEAMRERKLVIADGHHRYETALAYGDERRRGGEADDRAEYVMATFVRMETDGLTILPTHRILHSLPGFAWAHFRRQAERFFDWEELRVSGSAEELAQNFIKRLGQGAGGRTVMAAYRAPNQAALLRPRKDWDIERALPDVPDELRRVDVVILHRLLLERALRIPPQAVKEEKNITYMREASSALRAVDSGKAQICFLVNPTPIKTVWQAALAGHALPQKSTDFYPKLLSGLAIYWLDNPLGL